MYDLYGQPKTRTMRTLWLLEELGVPYTLYPVAPRSPEAMAVSPGGKVPLLMTTDGPIPDSVAQMSYLADTHGAFTHAAGTYDRGRQDSLTHLVNETMDAVLWAYAKHSFVLPEEHRVAAVKPSLTWEFAQAADAMVDRLGEGPFLMGVAPVVPDFLLAHCCTWAASLDFDLPDTLRQHMSAMRARPAYRRASGRG